MSKRKGDSEKETLKRNVDVPVQGWQRLTPIATYDLEKFKRNSSNRYMSRLNKTWNALNSIQPSLR